MKQGEWKWIVGGVAGILLGLWGSTGWAAEEGGRGEIRADKKELRGDIIDRRQDRREFRGQAKELKQDRRDDVKAGDIEGAKEITGDLKQLRGEAREERHEDRRAFHEDRGELREDRREWRQHHDRDNNPPGPGTSPNRRVVNPPGPRGGPGRGVMHGRR